MELRDNQPMSHEFGNRSYIVADVPPLDVDGTRTVLAGTVAWLIGFVALLPFRSQLADEGLDWMVWTCLAGAGLGCLGLEYCRRRRAARTRRDAEREVSP